jgi:hypothetical protein
MIECREEWNVNQQGASMWLVKEVMKIVSVTMWLMKDDGKCSGKQVVL